MDILKKFKKTIHIMKYYFRDVDDENCYTLSHWRNYLKENGLNEIKLFEAERIKSSDTEYFYCHVVGETGLKGENTCGRNCENYIPCNGKTGKCKFYGNTYEAKENFIILKNKEMRIENHDIIF